MEAESASSVTARSGKTWQTVTSRAGFVGTGARQVLPNSGTSVATNVVATSPQMSYQVRFSAPGTYYLWARGFGATTADDSVHAGLGNQVSANGMNFGALNKWVWFNRVLGSGARATIAVPSAGTHVVNLWMREDGAIIDRLVLTTNAAFTPSGSGPIQSPRG